MKITFDTDDMDNDAIDSLINLLELCGRDSDADFLRDEIDDSGCDATELDIY